MSVLDSVKLASKKATESGEDYIDATQDYIELKVFQQLSFSFALLAKILLIGGLCFMGLILVIVAGVLAWGDYLENDNLALLYTALILFALSTLIYLLRKPLIDSHIIKKISKAFFIQKK